MQIPLHIKFKSPSLVKEYQQLRERAQLIAEDMARYCHDHGVEFIITDIMSDENEDKKLKRVSKSHSEGRAFDVRVYGWKSEFVNKFEAHFEKLYEAWAATSKATGKKNLILFHNNGNGQHIHTQIAQYKES